MGNVSVKLRAIEPEDLDLLYRIENDADLWAVGATNVPYSRYTLHDYVANSSDDIYADRQLRLIIEKKDPSLLDSHLPSPTIGIADLINFDPRHQRAEVGIVIEQPYRRKGYAKATLHALHDYARRIIHLHQIYAVVSADNTAACQLFQALGYRHTATLADWIQLSDNTFSDAVMMQLMLC